MALQALLIKALRTLITSVADDVFTLYKGAKAVSQAKSAYSSIRAVKKIGSMLTEKGVKSATAKVWQGTIKELKDQWEEKIVGKLQTLEATELNTGTSIASASQKKALQMFSKLINDKKMTPRKLLNQMTKFIDQLDGDITKKIEQQKGKEIGELIDKMKKSDDLASVLNDYSPWNEEGTRRFAQELENKNWSIVAEIFKTIDYTIAFMKANGYKITAKLRRQIYAEIFGVYETSARRIYKRVNGKAVAAGSLYNEFAEYAKITGNKRELMNYVADRTAEEVVDTIGERLGIKRTKKYKQLRRDYGDIVGGMDAYVYPSKPKKKIKIKRKRK